MADSGEPVDKPFLYDAFISYRHVDRDRKWAEWLIEALERYRVPKSLQQSSLPPRLRKVFRDEDEVPASSDLNDQIRTALIASRFLIVVCSAFTPRSKWVEREIQIFNELGRSDQVLALLTEGEPADSFPDVMLVRHREVVDPDGSKRLVKEDKEPLAADVRPRPGVSSDKLKRLALMRLIAVILGVKFDDLRQREHERERKQRVTWAAVAAALLLLIGGGGGFYWDLMRPKTAYYRQLVWRWGVPEGAGKIDAETHSHLARSYSVITRRGKVIEVRHDGWIRAETDGHARWAIKYGGDGVAQRIDIFGSTGRLLREDVLRRETPSDKMIVSFERHNVPLAQEATQNLITDPTDTAPAPVQAKSEITRHELTFDDKGFATEVRYQDNWGTPQHDAQGSFGEHFTYSAEGLVVRSTEIGPNGKEITLKNGVHAVAKTYDAESRPVRLTLLGEDDEPINGPDGYAYYLRDYEDWGNGNDTAQIYYSADGKPTLGRNGYSKLVGHFDEHGNNIEASFYGVDGKRTPYKDGYAIEKRKFDDRGNVIEGNFFDINGQPTFANNGRAGYRQKFDPQGNIIEVDNFGIDGKLTITRQGFAKLTKAFDSRGNLVEEAYFGVDGKLMAAAYGVAVIRQTFDQRDDRIGMAFFDENGKSTLSKEGVAEATYTYDARGNEVERAFFDVAGKSILSNEGIAGFRQKFDDRGNLREWSAFGVKGEPVLSKAIGAADVRYDYDDHGRNTEVAYFGTDGKPILAPGGYAIARSGYDNRGYRIELAYFGIDGNPRLDAQHIARFKYGYDARGNEVERTFFGPDGKPTLAAGGQAGFRQTFDARGNIVELSHFGLDGKPTLYALGFASYRQKFDDRHNRIELSYFGLDGQPTLTREGIAKVTYSYDAHSNEIERAFFGVDSKPTLIAPGGFAGLRQAFDVRGNLITRTYFGFDGRPIPIRDGGYAKVTWTYDSRGYLTEESYFDADDKPAHDDVCVVIRYTYSDQGLQTKVSYLDAQGRELPMELVVRSIVPGGQAARVGLTAGDHLLTYNGRIVSSSKQLADLTGGTGFRALTVRRGTQIVTFDVWAGSLDMYLGLARVDAEPPANARPLAPAASAAPSR